VEYWALTPFSTHLWPIQQGALPCGFVAVCRVVWIPGIDVWPILCHQGILVNVESAERRERLGSRLANTHKVARQRSLPKAAQSSQGTMSFAALCVRVCAVPYAQPDRSLSVNQVLGR
jgi:hypothetical protein